MTHRNESLRGMGWSRRPSRTAPSGGSYQREEEGADGAGSLAEGAVLLQQQGDELVRLGRALHR